MKGIKGYVHARVWDEHDRLRHEQRFTNLVMKLSRNSIGNMLLGSPLCSGIQAIAVGTSSVLPTIGDTTLGAEIFRQAMPPFGTQTPVQMRFMSSTDPVVVTFAQTVTPFVGGAGIAAPGGVGSSFFAGEFGLLSDIAPMVDPTTLYPTTTSAPTLAAHSPASGSAPNADYAVKYTWQNANGETLPSSPSGTLTLSGQGCFNITLPAAPAQAVSVRIYISTAAGLFWYFGTAAASTTTFSVDVQPPTSGVNPPSANSSLVPGVYNSGTLFNHTIFPTPVEMLTNFRLGITNSLVLG